MKRISVFLIAIVAIVISTCNLATAQIAKFHRDAAVSYTDGYSGLIVSFAGNVDSVLTDTSKTFTFSGFGGESWYVNPIQYTKVLNAIYGKPYNKIIVQGLVDSSNWTAIDTIGTCDSLETVQRGTLDFNNWHCKQYRLIVSAPVNGALAASNDYTLSLYFLLPRKDN